MPKALVAALPHALHGSIREKSQLGPQDALRIVGGAGLLSIETGEAAAEAPAPCEASAPRSREDRRRFEAIAGRLRADLYRYAFWLSRDASMADDLVQEALMRGWKSIQSLKDESAVKQWLLTIVRREHARMYERKRLETVDIDEVKGFDDALATKPTDPDVAKLRQAILDLEPEYREPLVLQVLLGHGSTEIARQLGIKQGAVLTRLFRARKKLAAALTAVEA